MESQLNFIEKLKSNNIAIWVQDNKIKMSYGEQMPEAAIIDELKSKKAELMEFMLDQGLTSEAAFDQYKLPNQAQTEGSSSSNIEAIFPATSLQQGLVLHYLTQPQDDAYRVQLLMDYSEALNVKLYQEAWSLASLQYPILRTAFDWEEDILQVITKQAGITAKSFKIVDISDLDEAERSVKIQAIQQDDRKIGFDLSKPGLIRFTIIKQAEDYYTVLRSEHHSIADGWSGPFLMHTVHQFYNALMQGENPQVEPESAYIAAQNYFLESKGMVDSYWSDLKSKFGEPNDINLMLSERIDLNQTKSVDEPGEQYITISGSAYDQLVKTCRESGVTLNVAVQFAWHNLMRIFTGDEQTIVGTTVSGREIPVDGITSSVGLYANTLPLTIDWKTGATTVEMLKDIQLKIAGMNSYSSVSLASLQTGGERLFHTMCAYLNYPKPAEGNAEENKGIEHSMHFRQAVEKVDYPIIVRAHDASVHLLLEIKYGQDWLNEEQAQTILSQLVRILESVAQSPNLAFEAIPLLEEKEEQKVLHDWNQTEAAYPMDKTIQELFEKQVLETPDAIAAVHQDQSISYEELNVKANQLAHTLQSSYKEQHGKEIEADTFVAIYLDRSIDVLTSILAVLKVGAAYVPISPEYPVSRAEFILNDTGAAFMLLGQNHMADIVMDGWLMNLDNMPGLLIVDDPGFVQSASKDNPVCNTTSENLAYAIYTSGTTGQPKGVVVEHKAVISFTHKNGYMPEKGKRVASFAPYSFDGFVFDAFYSLLNGACVYLIDKALLLNTESLCDYLTENEVDSFFTTTAFFNQMIRSEALKNSALKNILFGGEKADLTTIQKALVDLPEVNLVHVYGPTETVVFATAFHFEGQETSNAPIGGPLNNKSLYVLNESGDLVPIGAPGELYIGGAGIARGYLNRPELTAERFVKNPFASTSDLESGYTHMYKTGDIVRWLPSGDIEFVGRADSQVKIRGHRIELGEIESVLSDLKEVKSAAVVDLVREGNKYIAAYFVPSTDQEVKPEALREKLMAKLPEYMLPTTFTAIEAIPLTVNGKLDRKALPDPEFVSSDQYVAPSGEVEEKLCQIWQEILGLEQVGVEDNFFHIGGDSIVGIRVLSKAKAEGIFFSVQDLFANPTVKELALAVAGNKEEQEEYQTCSLLSSTQKETLELNFGEQLHDAYPATQLQMGNALGIYA